MTGGEVVTTPIPLDRVVDEHRMELAVKRKRAMADGVITHQEAIEIFHYQERHLDPAVTNLTLTWGMVNSMLRGSDGMFGQRARRRWQELMGRAGNIVSFRAREDVSGDAA